MIKASKAWCDEYGKRNKWGNFAEDWFRLTGGQRITREIATFMNDEARLQLKPRNRDDADMEQAREFVEQLCEVGTLTLRDGFPAHRISPACRGDADWRRRELYQRSAEASLYAVIDAWAKVGYPFDLIDKGNAEGGWPAGPIKLTWQEDAQTPAVAMLGRLRDQWALESIASSLFSRWDFSSQQFGIIDLQDFDLRGANLCGANLSRANLSGVDLGKANLQFANLGRANLSCAYLVGTNLRGARLHRADLRGTDLSWANLNDALLWRADLSRAGPLGTDLSGAGLSLAYLFGTNLYETNLHEADLSEAYLSQACLKGAGRSPSCTEPTDHQSADLSGAINLTQEQIKRAYGDSETKLPDGMERPAHWSDED